MAFEELKVELKDSWREKTFVEEMVIDQERRIVHIYSEGGRDSLFPDVNYDNDKVTFSSPFQLYCNKIFNPDSYIRGLNNHNPGLDRVLSDLSDLKYALPEEQRESFLLERVRPLQLKVWMESWTWCFYSGGNTLYIYHNGFFRAVRIPKMFDTPQYYVDLLYSPFAERAIEIQNRYLRGEAGKF
ncbi:hypothetical protein [Planomicrobium okeanokoites]|uniref:hypothetical protein n=1 Tax=Planomicrobium okeanokoites TaxID=244 RepID=UPI00248F9F1C|nr:hypothetical protein [Planomicrobium okeanokoites]